MFRLKKRRLNPNGATEAPNLRIPMGLGLTKALRMPSWPPARPVIPRPRVAPANGRGAGCGYPARAIALARARGRAPKWPNELIFFLVRARARALALTPNVKKFRRAR